MFESDKSTPDIADINKGKVKYETFTTLDCVYKKGHTRFLEYDLYA